MVALSAEDLLESLPPGPAPPTQEVVDVVDELYGEWVTDHVDDVSTLHVWACERFGTSLDRVTPTILDDAMKRRIAQIKRLHFLIQEDDELRGDGVIRERITRISKVMREARNSVQAVAMLFYQLDDARQLATPDSWNADSYFQYVDDDDKLTNFQRLLVIVLKKLGVYGYRRMGDSVARQIILPDGEFSHAWEIVMSISEFIYTTIQKETSYDEWKCLTNPPDNGEKVVNHLMCSPQIEFPVLNLDRFIWSYNNGLYNVDEDMFWPFKGRFIRHLKDVTIERVTSLPVHQMMDDEAELTEELASVTGDGVFVWNVSENMELVAETCFKLDGKFYLNFLGRDSWPLLAKEMLRFRRGVVLLETDEINHELIASKLEEIELPATVPAMRVQVSEGICAYNREDDGGCFTAATIFVSNGTAYSNASGGEVWCTPKGTPYMLTPPTQDNVAVKHFDVHFRFEITPETEQDFDPQDIFLPEMERIMDAQNLTPDSKMWLMIMLCRLFFPVGYDLLQVVLFVKGVAGSGKSTLAQLMRFFFHSSHVTTLSSNIEAKFGLSAIYKGLLCICAEVRDNFGLDQAEWQSAASGEEVQIALKNKTAIQHKWTTPFFFLGNELPGYQNASGSVDRRFFMIEFSKKVLNSDPKLFDKFMKNVDLFQRKGVSMYHKQMRKSGGKDIWAPGVVGDQIMKWRDKMKSSIDVLHAFISSGKFEFTDDKNDVINLNEFKELYLEYRKSSGYNRVKFTSEHYETVFQEKGIAVQKQQREHPPNSGNFKNELYMLGVRWG